MAVGARLSCDLYVHHGQYNSLIKIILQQLFSGNSNYLTVCMPKHALKA